MADAAGRAVVARRVWFLLRRPAHLHAVLAALLLWRRAERVRPGLGVHFYFWLYFWSNLAAKYYRLGAQDFDLHSAPPGMGVADVARDAAQALVRLADLSRPRSKSYKQAVNTSAALAQLAERTRTHAFDEAPATEA